MKDERNDGGSAFPNTYEMSEHLGLSKRDYFAAAALQGMLAADRTELSIREMCEEAYVLADAMLKAREQ